MPPLPQAHPESFADLSKTLFPGRLDLTVASPISGRQVENPLVARFRDNPRYKFQDPDKGYREEIGKLKASGCLVDKYGKRVDKEKYSNRILSHVLYQIREVTGKDVVPQTKDYTAAADLARRVIKFSHECKLTASREDVDMAAFVTDLLKEVGWEEMRTGRAVKVEESVPDVKKLEIQNPYRDLPIPKQRENAKWNILDVIREINEKTGATLGISALSNLKVPTDLRRKLADAVLLRIDIAGYAPVDKNDMDLLLKSYQRLIQDEKDQANSALKTRNEFLDKHPRLIVKGMKIDRIETTIISDSNGLEHATEHFVSPDSRVSLVEVTDRGKAQDCIYIEESQTYRGNIDIVLADGVSGNVDGKYGARLIRFLAVNLLKRSGTLGNQLFRDLSQELNKMDIPIIIQGVMQNLQSEAKKAGNTPIGSSLTHYIEDLQKYLQKPTNPNKEDKLCASTATLVRYNRGISSLKYAIKSDSGIIVFHADGSTPSRYFNRSNGVHIFYDRRNDSKSWWEQDEMTGEISLKNDDVVMITTDFYTHHQDLINKINNALIEKRKQPLIQNQPHLLDALAMHRVKKEIADNYGKTGQIDDDSSAVFIHHYLPL